MKCEETCPQGKQNCCWECEDSAKCKKEDVCKNDPQFCKNKLDEIAEMSEMQEDPLAPAKGITLGLAISSLMWIAIIIIIVITLR